MAHINLASATNGKFPNTSPNDVQIYTDTSTPTFFIGASNSKNFLQITNTQTIMSNIYVTGQATTNTATISNLVITGAIWSSNGSGLQQYSLGSGGAPQSNVSQSNASFSNVSANYITAFNNLTVSSGGSVNLPSGSITGNTLDPTSTATLSNIILQSLNVSKIVNLPSNAVPWTAINSNTVSVPWGSVQVPSTAALNSTQVSYTTPTIPWTALLNTSNQIPWTSLQQSTMPNLTSNITQLSNTIPWTALNPATFSNISYVSSSNGINSIAWSAINSNTVRVPWSSLSNIPATGALNSSQITYTDGSIPWSVLSNTSNQIPFTSLQIPTSGIPWSVLSNSVVNNFQGTGSNSGSGTYASNSIPWTAINSNTYSNINFGSSTTSVTTILPTMIIEGGDFILTNTPYTGPGITAGSYSSNSIPWTALDSNTFSNISYVSASGGGNNTIVPNMLVEGGDLVITSAPYVAVGGASSLGSNMTFSNLTIGSNVLIGNFLGVNNPLPQVAIDVVGDIKGTRVLTTSDVRVKTNIVPLEAHDLLALLNPVRYEFKSTPGVSHVGLIAQEVEAVIPEAIHTTSDFVPLMEGSVPKVGDYVKFADGSVSQMTVDGVYDPPSDLPPLEILVDDFKTIDYNALVVYCIAAIKSSMIH